MVSSETAQTLPIDQISSPRISFSSEFLDESSFISIIPNPERNQDEKSRITNNPEFEFLSNTATLNNIITNQAMLTADELFFEGQLLPFWQVQHSVKLNKMTFRTTEPYYHERETDQEDVTNKNVVNDQQDSRVAANWFVDDDPSPRPPNCSVLWKELLKLKKQRANSSSLSPSSSSSSTSSSSSSLADIATEEERHSANRKKQQVKSIKNGSERTRSTASIKIRPMVHVPICSSRVKSTASALPPTFPLKKRR